MSNIATTQAVVVGTRSSRNYAEKFIASYLDCVDPGAWRMTRLNGVWTIVRHANDWDRKFTPDEIIEVESSIWDD